MSLPVNVHELITGMTVEWERIELKSGWNKLEIIQSVCAFANDINNWGGGYIIVGADEKDGQAVLPPIGVNRKKIDAMQKELMAICHLMQPNYFPVAEPVEVYNKTLLVIWVSGGEARPYKAPDTLKKGGSSSYYVRHFSSTKKASAAEERDLIRMSAHIPFDDRVNQHTELNDLKLPLIQDHLATIGSALLTQTSNMPFADLCRRMNIVTGPDEYLKPKNIGLLLFNDNPAQFFPCAQIDLVQFEDEIGDRFSERIFTGPVQRQLQDALLYIKNYIIVEKVQKVPGQAEAIRAFNYPYEAVEEALVNTVYHRSYEDDSPIEIRVYPNRIEMISYPGPLPPLNKTKLQSGKFTARKYRNRRIGDFLKELHLTEGRGTGIPKIKRAMKLNGSPSPLFETDDELSYFLTTLHVHPLWLRPRDINGTNDGDYDETNDRDNDSNSYGNMSDRRLIILRYCLRPKKRREVMHKIHLYNNSRNYTRHIKPLIEAGLLSLTLPDKPQSHYQEYRTTPEGQQYIERQIS